MSDSDTGSSVNTDAGAAGASSGTFSLSTGGLVAICVVVAVVVIAGVAVSVLWFLAKRRQWDVRATLRRASRRLTGRGPEPGYTRQRPATAGERKQHRRGGVRMQDMSSASAAGLGKSGARSKVVEMRDLEKGLPRQTAPSATQQQRQPQQQPQQQQQQQQQHNRHSSRAWLDKFHVATNDGR